MERLRSFSSKGAKSASSKLTPEQLKKQSTAKVRGLQHRHGELMKSLQEILKDVQSDSWETLKDVQSGSATEAPTPVAPAPPAPVAPVTLWRPENSKVKVMAMDGPAAKLNSRLRGVGMQMAEFSRDAFILALGLGYVRVIEFHIWSWVACGDVSGRRRRMGGGGAVFVDSVLRGSRDVEE